MYFSIISNELFASSNVAICIWVPAMLKHICLDRNSGNFGTASNETQLSKWVLNMAYSFNAISADIFSFILITHNLEYLCSDARTTSVKLESNDGLKWLLCLSRSAAIHHEDTSDILLETGTLLNHPLCRTSGPLLLTWINYNPRIDK